MNITQVARPALFCLGALLLCAGDSEIAAANDGFAGLKNGGLEFSRTKSVEMQSEVLSIEPRKIAVEYVFENVSSKDISGIVAFPLNIRCGYWDSPSDYPEHFQTLVDGRPIHTEVERRAFMRGDGGLDGYYTKFAKGHPGTEITVELRDAKLPIDCRKAPLGSNSYKSLISRRLALDPKVDPWVVFYETRVSYYWNQVFPARKAVTIAHSYVPSHGGGNNGAYGYPEVERNIQEYRRFYESHPALSSLAKNFKPTNGYVSIEYILTTANTWAAPIRNFKLVIPKPKHFVVTSFEGELSLSNGDLVISRQNFAPTSELTVVFYGESLGFNNVRF